MVDDDERPTTVTEARVSRPDEEETTRDARIGPGVEIGGYVIEAEIGKGGMGCVYSATHPVIGKRAAIKILKPEVSKSPIVLERFIQEARAVNQIGHPNIIDIFAFGQLPDGRAYHVMDLLVGESLRKRLRRGALNPSEAASVIDEIASALIAAHEKGFVHRDLKPDNVFLVEVPGGWPEVKLLDFGLAKLMPEAGKAPFQTKTGVMLGTPEYMSPEQARGIGVDYRTDVYALGVLTFEILAGSRPFPSMGDSYLTLQAHADEPPPSLGDLIPTLPVELVQLVAAMLAKEPAARPSLAAVRMVIKRLRTILPTRTAAGLEVGNLAAAPRPSPLIDPAQSLGDIRPSRLGAEPLIPGAGPQALATAPLVGSVAPGASVPSAMRPAALSQPPAPAPGPASALSAGTSQPLRPFHSPSPSTHGRGSGSSPSMPASPPLLVSSPGIRSASGERSPTSQPSGLAPTGVPVPGTVLGVGVPAIVKPPAPAAAAAPASDPGTRSSAKTPSVPSLSDEEPGTSNVWLVLGALLAIGAGVAIALVALGRL